jgi:hypothetical protein
MRNAGFIMSIQQVGSDVVETGSGTINFSALPDEGPASDTAFIWPSFPFGSLAVGGPTAGDPVEFYMGISGPSGFGSSAATPATLGSGDLAGVIANDGVYVPSGYVSGAALSDTSTYAIKTLAGLGLTPGTYTWTWGTGATADSFQLQIGPASTPEPSTFGLLALAAGGLMLGCCFRRAPAVNRAVKMDAACSSLSGRISPTEL